MKIGARTLKTGIAVAISIYVCMLLNIEPYLFAAASAVVSMQQSIGKSLTNAIEQIIANLMAVIVGLVLGLTVPLPYLSMGLATIIIILLCTKVTKTPKQIVIGVITAIFILASPQDQFIDHALIRSAAVLIGLIIANIINLTIAPPQHQKYLVDKLIDLNNFCVQAFIKAANCYFYSTPITEEDIEKKESEFNALFAETEKLYHLYSYEWSLGFINRKPKKNIAEQQLYKEYLNYSKGLWLRSKDIIFLAQERNIRREEANNPEISKEWSRIIELLLDVMFNAVGYNMELQNKVRGKKSEIYPQPRVWSKFSKILNEWQETSSTASFYIHVLTEISLITYAIRWFAKESTRLLNLETESKLP